MDASPKRGQDMWPEEREGYSQAPPVAYAPVRLAGSASSDVGIWVRRGEQLGSFISGMGMIWTAYAFFNHSTQAAAWLGVFPPGPLECTCTGVLIWLVAKWRRAVSRR